MVGTIFATEDKKHGRGKRVREMDGVAGPSKRRKLHKEEASDSDDSDVDEDFVEMVGAADAEDEAAFSDDGDMEDPDEIADREEAGTFGGKVFELGRDFNLSSTRLLDVLSDTPLTVDMHVGELPETSAAPERVLLDSDWDM